MKPTSYRLVFEGPDTSEAITIEGDISEAARTADEFRELLGWLTCHRTDASSTPCLTVRIEPAQAITSANNDLRAASQVGSHVDLTHPKAST